MAILKDLLLGSTVLTEKENSDPVSATKEGWFILDFSCFCKWKSEWQARHNILEQN